MGAAKDDSDWSADLLGDETRLNKRLDKLKLDLHVCAGDGNCQVRRPAPLPSLQA